MRSRRKNLQLAGIDVVLPAVVSIEAQEPERPKRMHVIAGFAAEEVDDIIPALVGQWLSHLCHGHFVDNGRGVDGDLAAEAFYDKLASAFSDHAPFVVTLIPRARNVRLVHRRLPSPLIGGRSSCALEISRTGAGLSESRNGRAQVTFDEFPGGITLVSRNGFPASIFRVFEQCHDVSAWYGCGVPRRDPAKVIVALRDQVADPRHTAIASRASAYV